jgi:pimeloyl-ACP methyl ester carboxylesterase
LSPSRRCLALLALLIGLATVVVAPEAASARVARVRIPAEPLVSAQPVPPHSLYAPSNAAARGPLRVLVALHGMGWDGSSFAAPLVAEAERQGWLLVAPTFPYGDWKDPEQVRRDDAAFLPQLKALLDSLPARTGLPTQPRALLYGFSRGGQLAHRFALFYPGSVAGVASFSCGTFTLPYTGGMPQAQSLPLSFPYAVGDLERYTGRPLDLDNLRRVSFLIGVGAADTAGGDLPRQWDHLGTNRLERANAYQQALAGLGIPAQMAVFPNAGHGENDEMRGRALGFLAALQ